MPAPHAALRRDRLTVITLLAAGFATYFATASAHLAGGDNAEFVTIFARGGVAHPPGYPLYCIFLRLCAWIPGGPVLGSSRATAVLGALSVGALYRACRAWGASPGASTVAAALYSLSPIAWRLATEAEVFALNALFASLLLWAAGPCNPVAPARRVPLLAGLAGLALSNHLTIALLAPTGLRATAQSLRATGSRVRVALLAAASFGAGLLPYLYCYEVGRAPGGRYVWGEPGTWSGLVRHVARADYGTLQLRAGDESLDVLSNVALFFTQTVSHTLAVPIAVGLFGFAWTWARAPTGAPAGAVSQRERRQDAIALFATWVLAGPVFAASLNAPLDAPGVMSVLERFRLLPEVVVTIGIAWGLDAWRGLRDGRAVAVVLAGIAVAGAFCSWPSVRAQHTDALERYTENTAACAPPGAVILGTGDYRLFSFLYADAIHLRPDVTYIDPHLLGYDWYRRQASSALGAPIALPSQAPDRAFELVDLGLSLGRPVLLTDVFEPQLVRVFPSYPYGTLVRLLPRGATPPPPGQVEQENLEVFARFRRWTPVARDNDWARAVLPAYERPWVALARMFERMGDEARAKANRERGEQWSGRLDGD